MKRTENAIVAMLVPGGTDNAGGIGRWAGYLMQEWARKAVAPPIVLLDTRGQGGLAIAMWRFGASLLMLARLRAAGRLAAVHLNLSAGGSTARKLIVAEAAGWLGVPVVLHLHSGRYFDFHRALPRAAQKAVGRMFRRAAQVITLGESWAWRVSAAFGVERATILVMPNGVRAPLQAPATAERATARILFLGRLAPAKGVAELIQALASDAVAGLAWQATLAGDGERAPYAAMAAASGLAERISFPGWLDGPSVAALLGDADLLVLPSHQENLPVCVIEALAHSVAVVATPVGALPELLRDGVSVRFVPVGDSVALARAIAALLGDPALRASIAAAGHTVFRDRLDIAAQVPRLQTLYRRLMA